MNEPFVTVTMHVPGGGGNEGLKIAFANKPENGPPHYHLLYMNIYIYVYIYIDIDE